VPLLPNFGLTEIDAETLNKYTPGGMSRYGIMLTEE